ncbi:uncharacterized protein LOC112324562 isoform X2 [Populus trichocarpa]|uniref:uncharacterized protein LOC112324562 isoform X2 n=1 Tax=Populus trichocarpa TaxID=3694 RepID=UPI000D188646|nr:uncharacterized protein LOC112324562 isoform X2 [Populus trichocarpa]|eukprot:XP_024443935.1 uncharacterized protein LOC112324562 isoform X2 [Populus trichocarpa]
MKTGLFSVITTDSIVIPVLPLVNSLLGVVGRVLSWFLVAFFVRGRVRQGSVNHFFLLWARASCGHAGFVFVPLRFLGDWISFFCHGLFWGCLTSLLCFNLPAECATGGLLLYGLDVDLGAFGHLLNFRPFCSLHLASSILLSFVTIYCFGCALSNKKLQCGRVVMFLPF